MNSITIFALITIAAGLLYHLIKRKYSYWERKGVPFLPPSIPRGNFQKFGKIHQGAMAHEFYTQMKGTGSQFFGVYGFSKPIAVVADPELIKAIMIRDFAHFQDRGSFSNERDDPLSGNLFALGGPKWRRLRAKLTPTFTSGKMKFMFSTVVKVADEFRRTLDSLLSTSGDDDGADVEIKDLLLRFTTDVIGQCAFGIECNSLQNPNAEFRQMGRNIFKLSGLRFFKFLLVNTVPGIAARLRLKLTPTNVERFFMGIVRETVEYRQANNVQRNDFMDLMIRLKEDGNDPITMNEISAQAFVFFLAGFETSSAVVAFALYELAANKQLQHRARKEIQTIRARYDGHLTYEAMMEMVYVEQILQESLRKYPPITNLIRVVTKPYKVPGMDFTFEMGTKLWIPVYALHHDADYYPKPEEFDPERFTPERIAKRNNSTYLPFGDGPRNCIGLRFGMMQARIGLITILANYEVSLSDRMASGPLVMSNKSFILTTEGDLYLKLKKLV